MKLLNYFGLKFKSSRDNNNNNNNNQRTTQDSPTLNFEDEIRPDFIRHTSTTQR
jgi:hypothetical protein